MAAFCLATGIAPSEYGKLTIAQYRAFANLLSANQTWQQL